MEMKKIGLRIGMRIEDRQKEKLRKSGGPVESERMEKKLEIACREPPKLEQKFLYI